MKKVIAILFAVMALMTSCVNVKEIGKINMIADRNIDLNNKYQLYSSYSGGSHKEIRKSKAKTIEDAVNQTVKKVPGGEFLMNAKIYLVEEIYIAVEGDVWGAISNSVSYRGFKVGDKVTWKKMGKFYTGKITALKDDKLCIIKNDIGDKTLEIIYDDLSKLSENQPTPLPSSPIIQPSPAVSLPKTPEANNFEFNIGDKIMFKNATGNFVDGKIIGLGQNYAIVEYLNPLKKFIKSQVKFDQLAKIKQ